MTWLSTLPMPDFVSHDGSCVLYQRDCLELLPMIPNGLTDAVVMDPPYSSGSRREGAKGLRKSMNRMTGDDDWFGSDCMTTNGFIWTMRTIAQNSKRVLCRGGHLLSFIDWRMSHNLADAIESADLRYLGLLVWDKVIIGMGTYFRNRHELILHFSHGRTRPVFRHDVSNVLCYPRIMSPSHETEKPVDLLGDLISTVSGDGEIILDPFMGSGSVGVACARLGRRFIGVEIEEKYFNIAVKRIETELKQERLFKEQTKPAEQGDLL